MTTLTQRSPAYALNVGGVSITDVVNQRLISLTLTDNRGFEADALDLVLDDADGALELPAKGATVQLSIGWVDTGTVDKGTYIVDELEHSGAPDQLTIRARSANLRAGLTEKREQSWHDTTLGGILTAIAFRHEMETAISPALETIPVPHIDQTNESDLNIMSRLAELHGAIATIKDGRLLFITAGTGTTASGKPLPVMTITRQDGDRHRFAVADREAYTAVRATYFDIKQNKRGEVIVNGNTAEALRERVQATEQAANARINGTDPTPPSFKIQHIYASKGKAIKGAKDQLKKGSYKAIQASYWDEKAKQKGEIEVTATGTKQLSKQRAIGPRVQDTKAKHASTVDAVMAASHTSTDPSFSDGGNIKTLRHTYATKETAFRGAMSAWQRLQRGLANFSITLAEGRPELMPELPANVNGFKPQIDAIDWTITRVVHNITESGYTTALELEARLTEIPD